jgi:hypothetical protein
MNASNIRQRLAGIFFAKAQKSLFGSLKIH